MSLFIVDSHCHLNMLNDLHMKDIISRGEGVGIKIFNTICTQKSDISDIKDLCNQYSCVFGSVGIHPNNVNLESEFLTASEIVSIIGQNNKIIGIGETGLDYYKNQDSDYTIQKKSFREHIIAAKHVNLPIIVHARGDVTDDLMETIQSVSNISSKNELKVLIHCFTGDKKLAKAILDFGFYFSLAGIVTFNGASDLQDIVKYMPIDRMLVETDCPYLTPHPFRKEKNEPYFIIHTLKKIAEIKNMEVEDVARITSINFLTLFDSTILSQYKEDD